MSKLKEKLAAKSAAQYVAYAAALIGLIADIAFIIVDGSDQTFTMGCFICVLLGSVLALSDLFKSFFDSLSISYFEAARVDGCSNIGMFFRIVIPLSLPIIAVIIIFQFNTAWGSFFWPYLLINDPNKVVLGQKLFSMKSNTPVDEYMCAMIFVIIPPAILYAIFQKQIMGGINIGGVKG